MSAHLDMNTKGRATAYVSPGAAHLARVELSVRVTAALWEENCTTSLTRTAAIYFRVKDQKGVTTYGSD